MNHDAKNINEAKQEWLESFDVLIAAPEHHEVLLENERVRILDSRIKPGNSTPVHTHRHAIVSVNLRTPAPRLGVNAQSNSVRIISIYGGAMQNA